MSVIINKGSLSNLVYFLCASKTSLIVSNGLLNVDSERALCVSRPSGNGNAQCPQGGVADGGFMEQLQWSVALCRSRRSPVILPRPTACHTPQVACRTQTLKHLALDAQRNFKFHLSPPEVRGMTRPETWP